MRGGRVSHELQEIASVQLSFHARWLTYCLVIIITEQIYSIKQNCKVSLLESMSSPSLAYDLILTALFDKVDDWYDFCKPILHCRVDARVSPWIVQ